MRRPSHSFRAMLKYLEKKQYAGKLLKEHVDFFLEIYLIAANRQLGSRKWVSWCCNVIKLAAKKCISERHACN